jgi:hypothetical protein
MLLSMVLDHIPGLYCAPTTLVFPVPLPQLPYGRLDLVLSSFYILYVSYCLIHLISEVAKKVETRADLIRELDFPQHFYYLQGSHKFVYRLDLSDV